MRPLALGPGAEFDAVRRMLARWGPAASGVGGDTAVLEIPAGERLVVSTDTSVENVHFRRAWLSPAEIGYRATAAALSDLAAAAATPRALLLALTLPRAWRDGLDAIADGVADAARAAGAAIVGGDLTSGELLSLTVTVLGSAAHPLSRAGARAGDVVYLTGRLGGPAAALAAWLAGVAPDPLDRARFAHPVARLREAQWLAARGATAAIDVSDGLVADAGHLAAASGVRIALDLSAAPRTAGTTAIEAGRAGEEYELAATAPAGLDLSGFTREFDLPLTAIGRVTGGPAGVEVVVAGARVDPPMGYNHLSD
jgi:thiamine-monophosphate kinase